MNEVGFIACGLAILGIGIPSILNFLHSKEVLKERKEHQEFYDFVKKHKTNYSNFTKNYYVPIQAAKDIIDTRLEQRKYIPAEKLADFDEGLEEVKRVYQKRVSEYNYQKYIIELNEKKIADYKKEYHLKYI